MPDADNTNIGSVHSVDSLADNNDVDDVSVRSTQVKMEWISGKSQWHMTDQNGDFLQEFYDCRNIKWFFPRLNKDKPGWYVVTIARV